MSKFKVTPKENVKRSSFVSRFELVKIQIIIAILSFIGITRITYLYITNNFEIQYIINLFWLVYNFYLLTMAIFFASERPKFRSSERVFISENAYIIGNRQTFSGKTVDISETGISISLEKPIYLDLNENHHIKVRTYRNSSNFLAKIVRVDNFNEMYKYVFNITEINEENFDQLLIKLYDRVPPFPEKQKRDHMITNILRNIKSRGKRILSLNRKLPRINIDKNVKIEVDQSEDSIHILDFNYMYIAVRKTKEYDEFVIPLGGELNINFHCILDKNLSQRNRKDILIYKITNYNEFTNCDLLSLLKSNTIYNEEEINKTLVIAQQEIAAMEEPSSN